MPGEKTMRLDLREHRFGRLVAIRPAPTRGRCTYWFCLCDCGSELSIMTQSLRSGLTKSCGCLMRETSAKTAVRNRTTHGMRHSAEYSVWGGIKRRCENKNDAAYSRYGGKGVECRFGGFEEFFDDVGPRPSPEHSIDRIDSFGHYEPENVRWLLLSLQNRNKKKTLHFNICGVSKPLADWCDDYGQPYKRVWQRIRQGWDPETALRKDAGCQTGTLPTTNFRRPQAC